MKTVLVVDDEEKIVDIVGAYLKSAGYAVLAAFDGEEALRLFELHAPDLVILDLMLPGKSGEDVCAAIRKRARTPVIMLTAKADERDIIGGLQLGADDYVMKPFSPRQLMARVEAVLRRAAPDEALYRVLCFGDGELVIDGARHEVRKHGERVPLTPTEFNILFTMAKHPTKTFTREELIAVAMEDDYEGYDRVIDTHIKNIRHKLGEQSRNSSCLKTIHGIGYAFGGE